MSFYENVFIARQEISTQQVDALAETFSNVIAENGGTVSKRENWGLKSLTFRIKKNRKGHYILLNIEAPSAAINEMERQMRLHEDIIRYMTVRVEELEEGPSIQARAGRDRDDERGERGDRGDRGDRPDRPRRRFGSGAARDEDVPVDLDLGDIR
jgi:small subunit ribosomal protein S6